jgi:predicted acetyltransferase
MQTVSDIQVTVAGIDDKSTVRQLMELYIYDFSEFMDFDSGPHGWYGYRYLDHYWTEPDCHPYLIHVDGKLAGFVLIDKREDDNYRTSVGEFFVMKKYRRKGVGTFVAHAVFDLLPGKWWVKQVATHPGSALFWTKVIGQYMKGKFDQRMEEHLGTLCPVQLFDNTTQSVVTDV